MHEHRVEELCERSDLIAFPLVIDDLLRGSSPPGSTRKMTPLRATRISNFIEPFPSWVIADTTQSASGRHGPGMGAKLSNDSYGTVRRTLGPGCGAMVTEIGP